MQSLMPGTLRRHFGAYSHGTEIPAGWRIVRTSGQLGIRPDDTIPDSPFDQATLCFEAIRAILAEAGMGPQDVAHVIHSFP